MGTRLLEFGGIRLVINQSIVTTLDLHITAGFVRTGSDVLSLPVMSGLGTLTE